ncbi:MAG: polysaccharide biosynthesis C-terminal domain-containing protein, partial [Bacteroidaceae bacterium]|nr:polysaccharide biosynthesis C-terminal domain-containing protein [Bacteroidaceae bacterium]
RVFPIFDVPKDTTQFSTLKVYFSGIGCTVLIFVNIIFVPRYGYIACAWAGFIGYATAMCLSYFIGQKKYPIAYPIKSIFTYVGIAVLFTAVMMLLPKSLPTKLRLVINSLLIILFIAHIVHYDMPLRNLPIIGKHFHK